MGMKLTCAYCNQEFVAAERRKFCCHRCFTNSRKGVYVPWNKGKSYTDEEKSHLDMAGLEHGHGWNKGMKGAQVAWNKGREGTRDDSHPNWKGDAASYQALHAWVARKLGQPSTCEMCGRAGLTGKHIQWANKSHEYRRDVGDWIRLCASCHKLYDLECRRAQRDGR